MATSATPKTILFLGATGGCGLSALRRSLAAGHTCIALCRTPAKLSDKLTAELRANLRIEQGNALDADAVARCLAHPSREGSIVDAVVFSIGGAFQPTKLSNDDPTVCQKSMEALVSALSSARSAGKAGRPRVIAISSTGVSELGRDIPLLMIPLYHVMLKEQHRDKKLMEDALIASGEEWTIVRPSLLTNGAESENAVRAGVEDTAGKKIEKKAVGYTISREDVGKWIFENLLEEKDATWVKKTATVTY